MEWTRRPLCKDSYLVEGYVEVQFVIWIHYTVALQIGGGRLKTNSKHYSGPDPLIRSPAM